ncbi:MAG: amylo-alpha-1,6-glucosidase [Elainellaceae cyanobacterium]
MGVTFGSEITGNLAIADSREWLVTNGLGSYGAGTVGGTLTRAYHGLLIAALNPPVDRTLLVTKVEETVQCDGKTVALSSNHWAGGSTSSEGHRQIQAFFLDGAIPTWHFFLGEALLEKRIWMQPGANTTYVAYRLLRGQSLQLSLKTLVNYRSHHGGTYRHQMRLEPVDGGVCVTAFDGAVPFYLLSDRGSSQITSPENWYANFRLDVEAYRGLNPIDDHLQASTVEVTLTPQAPQFTFVATTEQNPLMVGDQALLQRQAYEQEILNRWRLAQPSRKVNAPSWLDQLVLAADQFIVHRPIPTAEGVEPGKSVIAGYPWFNDWGRDTMISLPGLTLTTGRPEIAAGILKTFAQYLDKGMLPNRFPDGKSALRDGDYNTVDATLWYFEALRQYFQTTQDERLIRALFPKLAEVIHHHRQGTRYGIQLDPSDGLLMAGQEGDQLTWMDAKVDGFVVTPRRGKPVEVNALWYNALRTMARFAAQIGQDFSQYDTLANAAREGFQRFWNGEVGYCFDVIDGPEGKNDSSLRPNQLFALSLPEPLLTQEQAEQVLRICGQQLLTPCGIRSLAPSDAQYRGAYGGDRYQRDTAYHQGTAWSWLLGPFTLAHLRTYGNPDRALQFLEPVAYHLSTAGLGSISEILDGDAPYVPRGCFAQAWSVAEVLRAWAEITEYDY